MSKVTLQNWTLFGVHTVTVEIHEAGFDEDDDLVYQAAYGLLLDDGNHSLEEALELDSENQKHITIFLNQYDSDPKRLALRVATAASQLFENMSDIAMQFDENLNITEELIISNLIKESGIETVQLH